ncbi:YesL family protein [Bacillus sp. REN16]|uniref:YesL family protein n=1 Tax=Bacillus sp. REN16 TaxID=2887296 RepID=UPI001E524665|nr:YesL family protein [Bacillus sp. REN16]MCC3355895.1 YesL family protein [Bacillus sp. REN16]
MNGFMGGIYKLCEWIMRLAYINLVWILFTILGLGFLGFFPATISMFTIVRKWLMGFDEIPVFKTFWDSYKKDFLKGNLLGVFILVAGYILYIDIHFLRSTDSFINVLYYPTLLLCLGFILTLCYVFPTFVHFNVTVFQVVKNSFLIMLMNPLSTIMMVIGSLTIYMLMTTLPGLIPLFGGSALAFVIMWSAFLAFTRIERQRQTTTSE